MQVPSLLLNPCLHSHRSTPRHGRASIQVPWLDILLTMPKAAKKSTKKAAKKPKATKKAAKKTTKKAKKASPKK